MLKESRLAAFTAGALATILLLLFLIFNLMQTHYFGLQLNADLKNLRRDPLLQKTVLENPAELEFDDLRALAEKNGLNLLSSQTGEKNLEIVWQGTYKNFLEYLFTLSSEIYAELSQIEISGDTGKIVIKGNRS